MIRPPEEIADWTREAEALCRRIVPHELPGGVGCYVAAQTMLPVDFKGCPNARAWTAAWLDWRLRSWLESVERWTARGFCCIVRDEWLTYGRREFLGCVVHELGHFICWPDLCFSEQLPDDAPAWQHELIVCLKQQAAEMDAEMDDDDQHSPRCRQHGPKFVRACCHLRRRAECLGTKLYHGDVTAAGPTYDQSSGAAYERTLQKEIDATMNDPLRDVLAQPYPPAFARLWASDRPQDKRLPTS